MDLWEKDSRERRKKQKAGLRVGKRQRERETLHGESNNWNGDFDFLGRKRCFGKLGFE